MKPFHKSVITSLFSTAMDFGTLTFLVEVAHLHYVAAVFLGTVVGCTSNFIVARRWAFEATAGDWRYQVLRLLPVQAGSSVLQTLGVWLLTRFGSFHYELSKTIVAVAVYLGWNYPLNRWYVFRLSRAGRADTSTASALAAEPPS